MKKTETSELVLNEDFDICTTNPLEETKNHIDKRVDMVNRNIERIYNQSEEGLARAKDAYDISKSNMKAIEGLIDIVNDVQFRRTEFELGDDVVAKSFDGKKYKRGKIIGFGTGRRIFVATIFGHLIANENDTFLVKRQPKDRSKNETKE